MESEKHFVISDTVVPKMQNNRTMLFSIKQVNNGKCITAFRGSL